MEMQAADKKTDAQLRQPVPAGSQPRADPLPYATPRFCLLRFFIHTLPCSSCLQVHIISSKKVSSLTYESTFIPLERLPFLSSRYLNSSTAFVSVFLSLPGAHVH